MAMAISTSKHLQLHQCQLSSTSALRKFPPPHSSSASFRFHFPPPKHSLNSKSSPFFKVNARISHLNTEQEHSKKSRKGEIVENFDSGVSKDKRVVREFVENNVGSVEIDYGFSDRSKDKKFGKYVRGNGGIKGVGKKVGRIDVEGEISRVRFAENVPKMGGIERVSKGMDRNFKKGGSSSSQVKFAENVSKMGGIERISKGMDRNFKKGGSSSQVKFAENVSKMGGIERVSKEMDRNFKKGGSRQVKFAENVSKMGGIERISKGMDRNFKKGGSSSQVKFAENVSKMGGIERISKEMDRNFKKGGSSQVKFAENVSKMEGIECGTKKMNDVSKKGEGGGQVEARVGVKKRRKKGSDRLKDVSPEYKLRIGLDNCSKRGDFMGGIRLYDLAKREGITIGQYHYAVLLYLCSSAATGNIQPAKSGKGARSLSMADSSNEQDLDEIGKMDNENLENISGNCEEKEKDLSQFCNGYEELEGQTLDGLVRLMIGDAAERANDKGESYGLKVSEDMKNYALKRGSEIYEEMVLGKVPMNEASLTSLARMAMSMGNGDMAFDVVKKMKEFGISPRLRSYGPALSVFCNNGDVEKAFAVEEHMLEHGVNPEAPELEALLRASVEASKSDKVYYLLHKLRKYVRKVLPATADLIKKWFSSSTAARVGKRKCDPNVISKAIEERGGGWHGQGWLGKGKWKVVSTYVGEDGCCKGCGEKLVTIDLDPAETENFMESVARIAKERDRNSSFQKFQKWLDSHGPFEAVVDAANVGLFQSKTFSPSKVDQVADGIRQMLPSKKWPLIVLHNRRTTGGNMDQGVNRTLIAKWKIANALYATPTGSNDDWYWLYAAIKFKCLLVTTDEMRDHLFQLLGNDFFPKWKERHQVRFTRIHPNLEFQMPPPCSVVIQESEIGHWHVPIVSEKDSEGERPWLCITRSQTDKQK